MMKYYYICILVCVALTNHAQDLSVTFSKTERTCELGEAFVTIITAPPPVHYLWSNGAITSSVTQLEPGDYSVKVTDDQNKDTTIFFNIESLVCAPIPETHFTPNGDEFNDKWDIGGIGYFPDFDLFVYNRWGQLVHRQTSVYLSWDGKSLGLPLPDGTYYYILYFSQSDKNKFIKGPITIIR